MISNCTEKAVLGKPITEEDIVNDLRGLCDDNHHSCSNECPVSDANDGPVVPAMNGKGCACFKDGVLMLKFLRTGKAY